MIDDFYFYYGAWVNPPPGGIFLMSPLVVAIFLGLKSGSICLETGNKISLQYY